MMKFSPSIIAAAMLASVSLGACTADAPPVRSLSQMPDGGFSEPALDAFIHEKYGEFGDIRYLFAGADLNGDGRQEAIVYAGGPMLCGSGGCNVLVLEQDGDGFVTRMDASVSRLPVTMLDSTTNGWHDLTVHVAGGGIAAEHRLMRFDGTAYPGNPTVPPAQTAPQTGRVLIAEGADENLFRPNR